MEKFSIGFVYTEGGLVKVEADSAREAWEKLHSCLEKDGLDALSGASIYDRPQTNDRGFSDYNITHRDWNQV